MWSFIKSLFSSSTDVSTGHDLSSSIDSFGSTINPATGLPMISGSGGVDVQGNPFGVDLHSHHTIETTNTTIDHSWESSGSAFTDSSWTASGSSFTDTSWSSSSSSFSDDSWSSSSSSFDSSSSSWD